MQCSLRSCRPLVAAWGHVHIQVEFLTHVPLISDLTSLCVKIEFQFGDVPGGSKHKDLPRSRD